MLNTTRGYEVQFFARVIILVPNLRENILPINRPEGNFAYWQRFRGLDCGCKRHREDLSMCIPQDQEVLCSLAQ